MTIKRQIGSVPAAFSAITKGIGRFCSAGLSFVMISTSIAFVGFTSGCANLPSQLIIVRFEDLKEVREVKADFQSLEQSLDKGEWATFDKETMTFTIS